MKNLKHISLTLAAIFGFATVSLHAEKTCARCEEIRADNALHHQNYEYYEDYLKAQNQNEKPAAPQQKGCTGPGCKPQVSDNSTKPVKPGTTPTESDKVVHKKTKTTPNTNQPKN